MGDVEGTRSLEVEEKVLHHDIRHAITVLIIAFNCERVLII